MWLIISNSVQHTAAYPDTRGSRRNVTFDHCEKQYQRLNIKDNTKSDHQRIKQFDILPSNQITLKCPKTNMTDIQPL